jgi:hypothetical protein
MVCSIAPGSPPAGVPRLRRRAKQLGQRHDFVDRGEPAANVIPHRNREKEDAHDQAGDAAWRKLGHGAEADGAQAEFTYLPEKVS